MAAQTQKAEAHEGVFDTVEHARDHAKKALMVGGSLMVLTAITVAVAFLNVSIGWAVLIGMAVATTKGSLVAAFFMHLIDEKQVVIWSLVLTAFFFLVLLIVPLITEGSMHVVDP
jgi:cytochrome c oxidase subunit IV